MRTEQRVGILGAGAVGSHLVRCLSSAGYRLSVFDPDHARAVRLARHGATPVRVPADAAAGAGAVLVSLADERAVDDAVFDCGGVTESLPDGCLVLNLSATRGEYGAAASGQLASLGLVWAEAALVGSPAGAGAWSLCVAAGASGEELRRFERPVLSQLGRQVAVLDGADGADAMQTVTWIRMATAAAPTDLLAA